MTIPPRRAPTAKSPFAQAARAVAPDRGILATLAPATPNDGMTAEALARAVTLVGDDQHVGCGRPGLIEACG